MWAACVELRAWITNARLRSRSDQTVSVWPSTSLFLSAASSGSSRQCDFSWPVFFRCLWESCVEQTGQLTGFSLFNLQGYTSLVHFIYSHYRLVPSAAQALWNTHTHSHTHTHTHSLHSARLPASPNLAAENKEMSGHLLLQSGVGGWGDISQKLSLNLTTPKQNPCRPLHTRLTFTSFFLESLIYYCY